MERVAGLVEVDRREPQQIESCLDQLRMPDDNLDAIEFERSLKGAGRYEELRRVFNAEKSVDTVLYLTPNSEILYLLAVKLRYVRKRIGFALSKTFQANLLEADILSNSSAGEVISFREFLLG